MTGLSQVESPLVQHPCMGSVISRVRGMSESGVPPYVTMRKMSFPTATPLPTMLFYLQPGFLGRAHLPLSLSGTVEDLWKGPAVADLQLPPGVDRSRLGERRQLLASFDMMRRALDASGIVSSLDAFQGRAFEIVTSSALRDALDVSKESLHVRERYGASANGYHGQGAQMLLARRLVEAGVGFVEIALGYWDTHGPANVLGFPKMREKLCPTLDQSLSALIEDLHQRGLDKDVVIIVLGRVRPQPTDQQGRRPRPLAAGHVRRDRGGRFEDGPGHRLHRRPRRKPEGSPLQDFQRPRHHLPDHRHRPSNDLPRRLRPAALSAR
jgi:hypothetical protein